MLATEVDQQPEESVHHVELQDLLEAPSMDISLKTATELAVDESDRAEYKTKNDAIKVKDE